MNAQEQAPQGRTRRSPDGAFAGVGAVRQHGGSLPIYICNTCDREVVWAEGKAGRKYLANVAHGYRGQRYYIAARLHDCGPELARRDAADRESERLDEARYLLHLVQQHEVQGHQVPVARCIYCEKHVDERGAALGTMIDGALA